MSIKQERELIDLNARVAIAVGLGSVALLLTYVAFFR